MIRVDLCNNHSFYPLFFALSCFKIENILLNQKNRLRNHFFLIVSQSYCHPTNHDTRNPREPHVLFAILCLQGYIEVDNYGLL